METARWHGARLSFLLVTAGLAAASSGLPRIAGARVAGGAGARADCYAEFDGITAIPNSHPPRVECVDGDPCDQDGVCGNGFCGFNIRLCLNQNDPDIPVCRPPRDGLARVKVAPPRFSGLAAGLDLTKSTCGESLAVAVAAHRGPFGPDRPGRQQLRVIAWARNATPTVDSDEVMLVCQPRPQNRPCGATTTTSTTVASSTTTTSTSTTTTPTSSTSTSSTLPGVCTCAGGTPSGLTFTTTVGTGSCGSLKDGVGRPFLDLACGGLYFGGVNDAVPLPALVPDTGVSSLRVTACNGTALTLGATTQADTGSIRTCTGSGCLFQAPLPIPNSSNGGAPTSTCLIIRVAQDAQGTADCSAGSVTDLKLPLSASLFLTGDLLPDRCSEGSKPGASCKTAADCPGGGTCQNDTGRCRRGTRPADTACRANPDCGVGGSCERGRCVGGSDAGFGCITNDDCAGGTCNTLIQTCPICNATTRVCNGGPNDGLTCTPGDSPLSDAYPTSHDCPPPAGLVIGSPLAINFVLGTGATSVSATDLPDQPNVFCGFCRNKVSNSFKRPAVPCKSNADCTSVTGFTSCGQHSTGAFAATDSSLNPARSITMMGSAAGAFVAGGPAKAATLVSTFCVPPSFDLLVDSSADLPGPGAVSLAGLAQLTGAGAGTTTTTTSSSTTSSSTTSTTSSTTTTTAPIPTTTSTSTTSSTSTTTTSTSSTTTPSTSTTSTTSTTATTTSSSTTTTSTSTTTSTTSSTTTTTSSTTTTSTTIGPTCSCAGGPPTKVSFTTSVGSGVCGHLDADGHPNFLSLNCGALYFGGAGVGVPLPSTVPDQGMSFSTATCNGTTITLSGASPAEAGGNRCAGGSNHHNACTTAADCPGGTCKFLQCTNTGCLFGPPLPIPNRSHQGAATSSCVINTITANAAGTADCSTGSTTALNVPLSSSTFLDADLMPMRCSGGSTPGANCTGSGGCGTVLAGSCPGGTCVNDTGRCRAPDAPGRACCSDADCPSSASCETGACVGGANANLGCITNADCPSGTCRTFIQSCPICDPTSNKCNAGPNDGLACTPGNSPLGGEYPTSHDCPPPPANNLGALPIAFVLDSGTVSRTAANLPDQVNVFCGFCKNKNLNTFARRCNGLASGAVCSCSVGVPCLQCGGAPCLPVPCTSNASCTGATGFTSCGQRTSGAFCSGDTTSAVNPCGDLARTIVETGAPAGALTTGGPAKPAKLVSIFCIPLTFSSLVDSAADLPGPGAVAITGVTQALP